MSAEAKKALVCNYAVETKVFRLGALCYVLDPNPGSGGERVKIVARARGSNGRWVEKWEVRWRLHNFRVKLVYPERSVYKRLPAREWDDAEAAAWDRASNEERGRRLEKYGPAAYGQAQEVGHENP